MKKLISVFLGMLILFTSFSAFAQTEYLPQGIKATQDEYSELIETAIANSEYRADQIDKEHIFIVEHTSPIPMRKNEDAIWLYVAMPILGTSDISYAHFDDGEYVMAITNFAPFFGMETPYGQKLEHCLKANYLSEPTKITNVWVSERVHVFAYQLTCGGLEYIIPYYFTSESSFNVTNDESCQLDLGKAYLTEDFISICEREAKLYDEYRSVHNQKEDSHTYIDNEGEMVIETPKETPTPTQKPEETKEQVYTFEELTGLLREDIHHIAICNSADGIYYSTTYEQVITELYNTINTKSFVADDTEDIRGGFGYKILFFEAEDTPYSEAVTYTIPHGFMVGEHNYITTKEESFQIVVEKVYDLISNNCSDWAIEDVIVAKDLGFLDGMAEISYKEAITREQFCEIVYNMTYHVMTKKDFGVVPAVTQDIYFTDTDNIKVSALYWNGIINGKGNQLFAPDDFLTREEAATILYRVAEFMKMEMPQSAYLDGVEYYTDKDSISSWAFQAVFYLREMGIMEGMGEQRFSPKTSYTAEQAIATAIRLYNLF